MIALPDELRALKRFHGHLGPYAVLGYRMGQIARQRYPKKIFAIVHSGTRRPLSCLADGVQFSSCCTLGKGNITVKEDGEARVEFSDGTSQFSIETLPLVREHIDFHTTNQNEELIAMDIFNSAVEEIFVIREGQSVPFGR